jgi:hypothetical protein
MSSSQIPATIDTPLKDNGQNSRQSNGANPRRNSSFSRSSANSLIEQPGPVALPPLHPLQRQSSNALSSSFIRTRTNSDYDNDSVSVISNGSSVVPVDAGQHGFITYNDDASSTGSMVLSYEQGRDVPPAAYDLPAAIFNVYNPNNSDDKRIGEGLMPNRYSFSSLGVSEKTHKSSETDSVLLPYHVRTKLNASAQNSVSSSQSETGIIPTDVKGPPQSYAYGSIETGLAPPAVYYDNDDAGKQQNIAYDPSVGAYDNPPYHSRPIHPPYEDPRIRYNVQHASVSGHSRQTQSSQTQSSNGMVYISMLIGLIVFVVVVSALFSIMKTMQHHALD